MTTKVEVIADSVSGDGKRLTTFQYMAPRWILAEINTHRMISKSASSSRAIPVAKIIEAIKLDPAIPVTWGKNQKGMQAELPLNDVEADACLETWLDARDNAIQHAQTLIEIGLHKQVANRILEPWMHVHGVLTATEWDNFFYLRCHKDAQPEFQELAYKMRELMDASVPVQRGAWTHDSWGAKKWEEQDENFRWHLPYVTDLERRMHTKENLLKMSTARCARVSYNKHDGQTPQLQDDLDLYNRLVNANPKHMSPAEHQGHPDINAYTQSGNFWGWQQYRKTITGENYVRV